MQMSHQLLKQAASLMLLGVAGLPRVAHSDNGPADFTVHSTVTAVAPQRFGVNFNPSDYGDFYQNPIPYNSWLSSGGFAPVDTRQDWYVSAVAGGVVNGTPNTIVLDYTVNAQGSYSQPGSDRYGLYPSGYFVGSTARIYRFQNGGWTLIRTNQVTGFTAVALSTNPADHTVTLDSSGPDIHNGDVLWLDKDDDTSELGNFGNLWDPTTNDGTEIIGTVHDGPPGDTYGLPGTNLPLSLSVTGTGNANYGIFQYSTANNQAGSAQQFENYEAGHTYTASVWLKQNGISTRSVTFDGGFGNVHTWTGVTNQWQLFTWQFPAPTALVSNGPNVRLSFNGPGTAYYNNFKVYDASHADNTPDPRLVNSLQQFQPSVIRIWSGFGKGNGGYANWSMEAWLAPEDKRHTTWKGVSGSKNNLPNSLALCSQVGAIPWLIVNMSFTETEWSNLIDYLCAPAGQGYAQYRPSNHPGPYTADFNVLYLEFGNEEWGTDGSGDPIGNPFGGNAAYGEYAHHMLSQAIAGKTYFDANKVKFILNQDTPNPDTATFGTKGLAAAPEASLIDIFGYAGGVTSNGAFDYQADLLALYAEKNNFDKEALLASQSKAAGHPCQVAMYEAGPGTDDASYNGPGDTSLAAGVGTLDAWLYASQKGIGPINFFELHEGSALYSSHALFSKGFFPHPVWEALQMRNQYCNGDMVSVNQNQNPTISGQSAGAISVYAFHNGNQADVVVISRDLHAATPVTIHLPVAPNGAATLYKLTGDPVANNDSALNVPITSQNGISVGQNYTFTAAAGSVYLYQIPVASWPAVGPTGLAAIGYASQANLTWNPVSGATSYNIYRSTVPGGEGYTPYAAGVTSPSYVDSSVSSGVTYYYTVSAVIAGVATDQSGQATAQIGLIAGWNFAGKTGDETSDTATAVDPNVKVSSLTRGSGLLIEPSGYPSYQELPNTFSFYPAGNAYGGNLGASQTKNDFTTFTLTPNVGHTLSLSKVSLAAFYVGSATLVPTLAYSLDGSSFQTVAFSPGASAIAPASAANSVDVSGISALQNVGGTITLREYFCDTANNSYARGGIGPVPSADSLQVTGSVSNGTATPIVQINCGGGAVGSFAADSRFNGGNTYSDGAAVQTSGVTNPAPQSVYQSERYCLNNQSFTYTVPGLTPGGTYTVRLDFNAFGGVIVDNVTINGTLVLSNFNVAQNAGGSYIALAKSFAATADSSGVITTVIANPGSGNYASLEGLEILSSTAH